jgi:hypothetical protein
MSFISKLAAQRRKFLEALDANEGDINLDIFEDFYPDQAHFIFELLQNAEDAEATEAAFSLTRTSCFFEHNGKRAFTESDVKAITGIHNSSKSKAPDQIGKFGIGFKSVFVYTITPVVHSKDFSFKISRLVHPESIKGDPKIGDKTRFELPFNNPRKSAEDAYAEVEAGLTELAETTLLFLSNLESISWQIDKKVSGEVRRIRHSENHIEIMKKADDETKASSHFLRFSNSVEGLDKQRVSIAFELDFLPDVTEFDPQQALAKQLEIVPADPGRVAVFFPAGKEASGLRLHLHAPFVPELSRATIKKTPDNDPLFKQLADLAAASLHSIRDLNLLTREFLGVLPNPHDSLPSQYEPIRSAIIEEMNNASLTPTHAGSYAPARRLLRGSAPVRELISPEDIEFLIDYDDAPFQWATGATQKNSAVDRFLSGLAITEWDIDQYMELLWNKTYFKSSGPPHNITRSQLMAWLAAKPDEWQQKMYALFHGHIHAWAEHERNNALDCLKRLHIVRLSNGEYGKGSECYFPGNRIERDDALPRVAEGVYTSGENRAEQEEARKLLEEIGVREAGEIDQIQAILKRRYSYDAEIPDEKKHLKDINRFIALVEKKPDAAALFADFYIFKCADGQWRKPNGIYIDSPFLETGLSVYYDAVGPDGGRVALSDSYRKARTQRDKFLMFAGEVGVQFRLEIKEVSCDENPGVEHLIDEQGNWSVTYGINQDYTIEGLTSLLARNDEALSRLIWRTLCDRKDGDWLLAKYRKNSHYPVRTAASQLVCRLRDSDWVPQTDGLFVRPSKASRELLPKGFPWDERYEWLAAVRFGEADGNRFEGDRQRPETGKALWFSDEEALERARRFTSLPQEVQEGILAEFQSRQGLASPEPGSLELRAERMEQPAAGAPESEKPMRVVSVGREAVTEAEQYLREQYTNGEGKMFCQICNDELPFKKLADGAYYFETVEFIAGLKKRHYQNYLALCPIHSAMFKHANDSRDDLKGMLGELAENRLEIVLAQKDAAIYFTKKHLADLRKVLEDDKADDGLDYATTNGLSRGIIGENRT